MTKPLHGLRVLDFTKVLAGPLCTQYLADMGAEVIKVEPVETGDETRGWPPFREPGLGAVFLSVNRGKRSIALDLKTEEGLNIARELARGADICVQSFGSGAADRLGVGPEAMRALNPRLIYCNISGFGPEGPMRDAPGYDVIMQAFSGMMALTGDADSAPMRSPISPIDQGTGLHAVTGILAALNARHATGEGTLVEVSLFETALGLLGYNLQTFWETGEEPAKCGSSHASLCPYGAFAARDGMILLGVANDSLWRRFCVVAGMDDLVEHPEFRTNGERVTNRHATEARVEEVLKTRDKDHWLSELAKVKVPAAPINGLAEISAHPHTAAAGIVESCSHPQVGEFKTVLQPVRFAGEARKVDRPPPLLGEHTEAVLLELGLGSARIDDLRRSQVIG